jgi:hypothetical protein
MLAILGRVAALAITVGGLALAIAASTYYHRRRDRDRAAVGIRPRQGSAC